MERKLHLRVRQRKQLIKYYHASLSSHPKRTIKHGYLKRLKGLTAERVNSNIGVKYATEAGHMRTLPKGVRSTTSKTKRGRHKESQIDEEREATAPEVAETPAQVPGNKKTYLVFMTRVLADD